MTTMSLRKSSRLSAKAEQPPTAGGGPSQRPERVPRNQKASTKKPRVEKPDEVVTKAVDRTNYSRIKGVRGKLKNMTEMPVDILFEVFSALQPGDLLCISRASKDLRGLLTSKNTAYIWSQAYKNIPEDFQPPQCPKNVNVLHYTNFLYGHHCQFCASRHGYYSHFPTRVRFCKGCAPDVLRHVGRPYHQFGDSQEKIEDLCSAMYLSKPIRGFYILNVEYRLRSKEYADAKNLSPEAGKAYLKTCQDEQRSALELGTSLQQWRRKQKSMHQQQVQDIHKQRANFILEKLEEEGIKDFDQWQIKNSLIARRSYEMKGEEWLRIRADLIDVIQEKREAGQHNIVRMSISKALNTFGTFIASLNDESTTHIFPRPFVIAQSEPFLSLIRQSENGKISQSVFEPFKTECSNLIAAWKAESDKYLVDILPPSSVKGKRKKLDARALDLATTFFKCHFCTEPISYPRVLVHQCLNVHFDATSDEEEAEHSEQSDEDEDLEQVTTKKGGPYREPRPARIITMETLWDKVPTFVPTGFRAGHPCIAFDEESFALAREVVRACGEDPNTASREAIEKKNARLECMTCHKALESKVKTHFAMTWIMAILHDIEYHFEDKEAHWRMIDNEAELAKIKGLESKSTKQSKSHPFVCKICQYPVAQEYRRNHIKWSHRNRSDGVAIQADSTDDINSLDEYFIPNIDASIIAPPFPVKY
ncbi:hypothetical protein CPB83DRAFT_847356 [Crepidotus variabilis]|uniref:F-box domain-containing protein n=1 Tax=Crepidotus variabilis TaxID=179855 RepID=A0A9P6EN34_9AGAR|nr:hypothetical protein CPB83DRAFT_847356 [Crepidotus variabilis]